MERSEAKEGVSVRYTPVTSGAIAGAINHCGTLEKPNPLTEFGCYVKFDSGPKYYCTYRNLTVLEPPALSPIVTETRRYIKAGQYGNLTVYEGPAKDIRIEFTTCSHTPAQMRAAAKVLNQIAEVLEENAS